MRKVIITCALTGAQQGKEANPNLPEQPEEIIAQAVDAWKAGAAICHVHARDASRKPTADLSIFRRIANGIREKTSDLILNLTTGGAIAGLPLEDRLRVMTELKPDIASFSCGGGSLLGRYSLTEKKWLRDNFVRLFQNYAEIEKTALLFLENNVKPELEIYDTGFLNNVWTLAEMGVLKKPYLINFVMGMPGECTKANVKNLLHLVETMPADSVWHVSAIGGKNHFPMTTAAVIMGGNIRVGMEDNVYVEKGRLAKSNAELVEKAVRILRELGFEIATSKEAREVLFPHS